MLTSASFFCGEVTFYVAEDMKNVTAKSCVSHILDKLSVAGRTEAVALAVRHATSTCCVNGRFPL